MNWKQHILSWLGASYFMHKDSQHGFSIDRAYRRGGYYWRKGYGKTDKGKQSWLPMHKRHMAKDLHALINHKPGASHDYDTDNQWAPLTKSMKAWYVMLEDEPLT